MKKTHLLFRFSVILGLAYSLLLVGAPIARAAYNPNYLISDTLFMDYSSMSEASIQSFLVGKNSGLKNLSFTEACSPSVPVQPYSFTYFPRCGQNVSAAGLIYDTAVAYRISPKAILATLQKEQSLITTPNPDSSQLDWAMGYGCPSTCNEAFRGFFRQVDNGAWQFRLNIELMNNRNWWGYAPTSYACKNPSSLYSAGLYPGNTVTFYNPGGTARTVTIANSSTASLYCYTPHVGPFSETGFSGSYNFVTAFEQWFGSVSSPCYNDNNVAGAPAGQKFLAYNFNGTGERLTYTQMNNAGSYCTEVHVWNSGFNSWLTNVATGMRAFDPAGGTLALVPITASRQDNLAYIVYSGSGGLVEVHKISPGLDKFPGYYDVPTNLSGVTATSGSFVSGDFFGRGNKQLAYILYSGAGGRMEVHMFDPSLTKAVGYYDLASDLGGITSTSGVFVAGDFFGRGYSQLAYVTYGSTTVHVLDIRTGRVVRMYEVPTNLSGTSNTTGTFVAGDFLGRGYSQLVYVIYNNGSRVETHMFNPALTQATGFQDIITNLGGFSIP